ncbi:MAG: thiamine-phosphate kinase [Myxococcales bacterium]|nr:thiamine-phosphate kinase [Myxococcales bacterium]|tara:strand:+ start:597 stop:1601 length:1005 start_codon:yes stop_codon:yes gene_type:complete
MNNGGSRFGPGAEFDLITRLHDFDSELPPGVGLGPGDDAALLEDGWVVSTDLCVEGVHFRREWITDKEVGYRAATAALSDMAAMAAVPVGLLVSIAAQRGGAFDLEQVQAGIQEAAVKVGASVIGGDVSASPGPLVVDVVALGKSASPVRRDGAKSGGEVWVTGSLGSSAAAVRIWRDGGTPTEALRSAFVTPAARVNEALYIAKDLFAHAMIDISDGLIGDAGHIAASSGVKITLNALDIPITRAAINHFGRAKALRDALVGGEDYELCFVTDPDTVDPLHFLDRYGVTVTKVGSVAEGEGVWLKEEDGTLSAFDSGGFDHWGVEERVTERES